MNSIEEKCEILLQNYCVVVDSENELEELLSKCVIPRFVDDEHDWGDAPIPITPNIIICEGDSWFTYAYIVGFIAKMLGEKVGKNHTNQNKVPWIIVNLAKTGDKICNMFSPTSSTENQSKSIIKILDNHKDKVKYLFLSGGGNDVIDIMSINESKTEAKLPGDECECSFNKNFLKNFNTKMQTAKDCIDDNILDEAFNNLYGLYYSFLFENSGKLSDVKIVFHTYDYFKQFGEGVEKDDLIPKFIQIFLPWQANVFFGIVINAIGSGPWLSKAMGMGKEGKHIPSELWDDIVKHLLDKFSENVLEKLNNQSQSLGVNIDILNLKGLLPDKDNDWKDEIHPSYSGAQKIAIKFVDKINV